MSRFFAKTENIGNTQIIIDGEDVNHMKNVLRVRVGDEVTISGGTNVDYRCSVATYESDRVLLDILEAVDCDKELSARVHLFQGLPKGDKMELIIQKCVELGVYEIIPVAMKRCVMKLEPKKEENKIKRWQAIAEGAAKQSGRSMIPSIHKVMTMKEALAYAQTMEIGMIPYELCEGMEATREVLSRIKPGMDIAVFIGPEGGLEVTEVEAAVSQGIESISLGRRILRTETAGLTVMAWIMYRLETM